jgi:hypothetical protein
MEILLLHFPEMVQRRMIPQKLQMKMWAIT